jgi:hypothetical protein
MKTLTTLTAVAALIAGLSIASAQSPMSQDKASSMGKTSTQATGTGKFCITSASGGALNCKYASLAACEQDAKTNSQTCSANPNQGTTGSKQ